jgi:glycosyltransferase involved in cell wall biosynthesis
MKLIVQIPCLNEADTLEDTLADIPRQIDGVDKVEIMVIDDGSTDDTVAVARACGVDHILINRNNLGLARTFRRGLDACLHLGADIIVNTDGDNQYAGADIPKLIQPILEGRADVVVGDRKTGLNQEFSPLKRLLQRVGSHVVRTLSEVDVPDAVSGFRAISRAAALRLNIVSPFSYTTEMLIQVGKKHMAVTSVPVATNPKTRESRLFRSISGFIAKQLTTIVRMYAMYQPLRVFFVIGTGLSIVGLLPVLRFLYFYAIGSGDGHIQSLVLGGVLILMGFMAYLAGLVADLISFNRQLIEFTLEKVRMLELSLPEPSQSQDDDAPRNRVA